MPTIETSTRSLAELRSELEGIDRSLLLLMAERIRVARDAIALRRLHGEKVTDSAQERRVLARALRWAEEMNLSSQLVTPLLTQLIAEGKRAGPSSAPSKVVTVFLTHEPLSREPGWAPVHSLRPSRSADLVASAAGGGR